MIKHISWLSHRRKKTIFSGLLLAVFGFSILSPSAEARLIFSTENDGTESDTYTLDVEGDIADAENTDMTLNFGGGLTTPGSITYNDSTGEFTFNKDVNLSGQELIDFIVERSAGAPVACTAPDDGRIYYDTTDDLIYVCDGDATSWTSVTGENLYSADGSLAANRTISTAGNTLNIGDGTDSVQIESDGDITFVDADGDATIAGPAGGDLILDDAVDVTGNLDAQGTISDSTGNLQLDDAVDITGNLDAQGDIANSTGDVTVNDALDVVGAIDAQGNISDSLGNLTLDDAVDVTGILDAQATIVDTTGDLTLDDDTVITGTLDAQGAISDSAGNLVLDDDVDVANGLDVQGAAGVTLSNDETITNAADGSIVLTDSVGSQNLTFDLDASDITLTSSTGGFNIGLGGAAGDDLIVDTDTLVVESDNDRVGIGTAAPNSTLQVDGSWATVTETISALTTTLDDTHNTVLADANANAVTLNLPAAAGVAGRLYTIKAVDVSNTITIDGDATETIDGSATLTLDSVNDSVTIQSDGTNWVRVGSEIASAADNTIYNADDTLTGNRKVSSGGFTLDFGGATDTIQFAANSGDITFIDADGGSSITGSTGGALNIAAGAGQGLDLDANAASTLDVAGTMDIDSTGALGLNETNNAAINTGTGLFTTGGDLTATGDVTVTGNDLTFGNGESISNATDNVVAITSASTTLSGALDVQGGDITLENDETISNSTDGVVVITSPATELTGALDVQGGDITLENDETISNSTDGTVDITADTTALSGDLTVTGNDIDFGNGESISNATDNVVAITSASTTLSGALDVQGGDITLENDETISNSTDGTIDITATTTSVSQSLEVGGSFGTNTTVASTVAFAVDATHSTLLADASSNAVTLNLPAAAGVAGRIYTIKAEDVSNTITIDPNAAETIDGDTTVVLSDIDDSVTIQSDGTNWVKIYDYGGTATRNATVNMPVEFPNFTLVADGSDNRGTFESDHDATAVRNYYQWGTRRATQQDYDLVVQWPVPEDFVDFQDTNPIQFLYQTTDATAGDNEIDVIGMSDTANAAVTFTGGSDTTDLVSVAWATGNLDYTGTPTFTPGDYITLTFRLHAENGVVSRMGEMIFNYVAK